MGRRYFYAIVDETHDRLERQQQASTGQWTPGEQHKFKGMRKRGPS